VSALQAVYHVVEHFSYHVGQIVYIYKLRTGADPNVLCDPEQRSPKSIVIRAAEHIFRSEGVVGRSPCQSSCPDL
jgi:hypothetical protein